MILSDKIPLTGAYCLRPLDPGDLTASVRDLANCAEAAVDGKRCPLEDVEKEAVRQVLPKLAHSILLSSRSSDRVSEGDFIRAQARAAFTALRKAAPDIHPFMEQVLISFIRDWTRLSRDSETRELHVLSGARKEAYDSFCRKGAGDRPYSLHVRERSRSEGYPLDLHLGFSSFRGALAFGRRLLENPEVCDLSAFMHGANPADLLPAVITDNASGQPIAEILYGDGVPRTDIRCALLASWPGEREGPGTIARLAGPDVCVRVPAGDVRDALAFAELCRGQSSLIRSVGIEENGRVRGLSMESDHPKPRVVPPQQLLKAEPGVFDAIREQAFQDILDGSLQRFLDLAAENPGLGAGNLLLCHAQIPENAEPFRVMTSSGWKKTGISVSSADPGIVLQLPDGRGGAKNTAAYAQNVRNRDLGIAPDPRQVCRLFGQDGADPADAAKLISQLTDRLLAAPLGFCREDRDFLRGCATYIVCRALGFPAPSAPQFLYAAGKPDLTEAVLRHSIPAARETLQRTRAKTRRLETSRSEHDRRSGADSKKSEKPNARRPEEMVRSTRDLPLPAGRRKDKETHLAKRQYTQEEKQEFARKRKSEVEGLCASLEQGLEELRDSNRYREYLRVMSRFHDYSFSNSMLILKAKPDATYVLGFNDWKKLGRSVMKGERGIRIIAPMVVRTDDLDQEGNKKTVLAGFKPVSVFDISQTAGKELPQLSMPLKGGVQDYDKLFSALVESERICVERRELPGDAFGCCDSRTGKITIRPDISQQQTIKTLIHEIAHRRMHPFGNHIPKDEREIQAESVAYVACAHFGIDTGDYTFGYLDSWLHGKSTDLLRQSLGTISSHAHEIIAGTDAVLERNRELGREVSQETEPREADQPYADRKAPGPQETGKAFHNRPPSRDASGNQALRTKKRAAMQMER